jgi:virulence factor Mce-like protein
VRRLGALAALAAAAALALALTGPGGAGADAAYRVDAIFDTAKGIVPGQLVKIAGARAGRIEDVVLTPGHQARIQMTVDRRFAPFRSDARCQIQPEGLISENFVQCEPGTPEGRPLRPAGGEAPTVPVARTSVPVSITDLFNIWKVPVRDRLAVVLATLGAGVAGRGEDLNALLRRASPALSLVRRASAIANRQRRDVERLVDATDTVVAQLARRRGRVRAFVDRADRVTRRTAAKRGELAESVRRLPGLLAATEPALRRLDAVSTAGTPVLRDLRSAAPAAGRLVGDLAPFARQGRRALRSLGAAAAQGRGTVRSAGPVVDLLRRFAAPAVPAGTGLSQLFVSLRERGFVEGLLSFVYGVASASSRFDAVSHFVPTRVSVTACTPYATTPAPGCSARFGAARGGARARPPRPAAAPRDAARLPELLPAPPPPAAPAGGRAPAPPQAPDVPRILAPIDDVLGGVLGRRDPPAPSPDRARDGLLDFLLR